MYNTTITVIDKNLEDEYGAIDISDKGCKIDFSKDGPGVTDVAPLPQPSWYYKA